jgi:hypothetical protein
VKFSYTRYSESVLRPVIPITLHHDAAVADYTVLIDSGADINVFAYELAEYLGIDVQTGEARTFVGVSGRPEEFFLHPIKLEVGNQVIPVEAGFARSMDQKPYGIVGQRGFFDQFRVMFDLTTEVIELTPRRPLQVARERGKAA